MTFSAVHLSLHAVPVTFRKQTLLAVRWAGLSSFMNLQVAVSAVMAFPTAAVGEWEFVGACFLS